MSTAERILERLPEDGVNQLFRLPVCPAPVSHPPPFSLEARYFLCWAKLFPALSSKTGVFLVSRFGLTSPPSHHIPLWGAALGERFSQGGLSRTGGSTCDSHCPQDGPGSENPKSETIPSPPFSLPHPQCSQGTLSV